MLHVYLHLNRLNSACSIHKLILCIIQTDLLLSVILLRLVGVYSPNRR